MAARFDLVGLVVSDMARTLAFYRALGLDIPADADGEGHVEAELPGGLRIAWDTIEIIHMFDPEWQAPQGGHRISLAFLCDTPDEVNELYGRLVAAGHHGHKEPWDAFWGQRYAIVYDPDGTPIDLFARL